MSAFFAFLHREKSNTTGRVARESFTPTLSQNRT